MLHSIQGFCDIEWKEPVDLRAAPGDSSFKVVILRVLEERLALYVAGVKITALLHSLVFACFTGLVIFMVTHA